MKAKSAVSPPPHSGHRARLRARLEREPLAVEDHEILELLLGYALPRRDTKPLAKELLCRFGSIRGVLDARPDELVQTTGFGNGPAALWRLLREVMARYEDAPLRLREALASPEAVARMARQRLGNSPHEECWLALVDQGNHLLAWERLRRGNIDRVALQPREVLEMALLRRASGVILVHNHPGGSPSPSQPDMVLTQELQDLAPRMGIRFLDHLIITEGECYSILLRKRI